MRLKVLVILGLTALGWFLSEFRRTESFGYKEVHVNELDAAITIRLVTLGNRSETGFFRKSEFGNPYELRMFSPRDKREVSVEDVELTAADNPQNSISLGDNTVDPKSRYPIQWAYLSRERPKLNYCDYVLTFNLISADRNAAKKRKAIRILIARDLKVSWSNDFLDRIFSG